jgi:hypothetical protein
MSNTSVWTLLCDARAAPSDDSCSATAPPDRELQLKYAAAVRCSTLLQLQWCASNGRQNRHATGSEVCAASTVLSPLQVW